MHIQIREGEFEIGSSMDGRVVIGFRKSIQDLQSIKNILKFVGADVDAQWAGFINNRTNNLDKVILVLEWPALQEILHIPFRMSEPKHVDAIKRIVAHKIVLLTNIELDDIEQFFRRIGVVVGVSHGITVDVTPRDVLEWMDLEEKGELTKDWKPKQESV